jgi:hypothetical protein
MIDTVTDGMIVSIGASIGRSGPDITAIVIIGTGGSTATTTTVIRTAPARSGFTRIRGGGDKRCHVFGDRQEEYLSRAQLIGSKTWSECV